MSPDPRYLFMAPRIQEAWGAIEYGIRSREGIILLTGEAGTGKTSLIRRLLEWLHEHDAVTWQMFATLVEGQDGLYRWADKPWLPLSFSLRATRP